VRGAPAPGTTGLGPVPRSVAERVVEAFETVIPLRPCRPRLRRAQDNPACMLKDLHRCEAVCDGTQTPEAYAAVVTQAEAAMHDPSPVLAALRERMRELASEGAFEQAAECREQLAAVVRSADARRHHDLMAATRLVLERRRDADPRTAVGDPRARMVEVVAVAYGRVVATWSDPSVERSTIMDALDADAAMGGDPDGPGPVGREESDLLRRWLGSDDVLVREVEGVFASPVAGGADLAALRHELRVAERSGRGDDVVLSREKVRRRSDHATDTTGDAVTRARDLRPT